MSEVKVRRSFDEMYKREAVKMVEEGRGITAVARELGLCPKSLRKWRRDYGTAPTNSDSVSKESLEIENRRLRKELRDAEEERDILKKATVYFAIQTRR